MPALRLSSYAANNGGEQTSRSTPDQPDISGIGNSSGRQTGTSSAGVVLGPGDVIEFRMFGQPDMLTTSYVSDDGKVSLPLLQQVGVGGLTPSEVQTKVAKAYRDGGFFTNPQVNITIAQYRSQQISVLGEVAQPGRYPLETRTGVLDALAVAQGVTPKGARDVVVIREVTGGTRRYKLSLDALVEGTGKLSSFTLAPGDTVFVPQAPLFYIYGEVRQPAAYAIQPGMSVRQALATGGGLTERGSNSRIVIEREENSGTHSFTPELSDRVRADDVIYVKERIF